MSLSQTFFEEYVKVVSDSLFNNHTDNYDWLRFGEQPPSRRDLSWKGILRGVLKRRNYIHAYGLVEASLSPFQLIAPYAHRLHWLYDRLADDESKRLLTLVLAYRALGYRKVKLPLNTREYWQNIQQIDQLSNKQDYIQAPFLDWKLYRMRLDSLGFPIEFYFTAKGVYTQFGLQQYRCLIDDQAIEAEPGDYVIDGGACWGDTALYFAHKVGIDGQVFSFEFVPTNLEILRKNLELNPCLEERVTVVENAMWSATDLPIYFTDNGPGSRVTLEEFHNNTGQTTTLTIDDLVRRKNPKRMDFIKMDIEGAELPALKGGVDTIKRFRPKLAISIYHRLSDFLEIPEFIDSLNLGYRFHIRHLTIHSEETVLFAQAPRQ